MQRASSASSQYSIRLPKVTGMAAPPGRNSTCVSSLRRVVKVSKMTWPNRGDVREMYGRYTGDLRARVVRVSRMTWPMLSASTPSLSMSRSARSDWRARGLGLESGSG